MRPAARRLVVSRVTAANLCLVCAAACGAPSEPAAPATSSFEPAQTPTFRDVAADVGLVFRHFSGSSEQYFFPEIMGAGVALLDYDSDGDLDVYLVQGERLAPDTDTTGGSEHDGFEPGNRLFENTLAPAGVLGFRDVTDQAGVGHMCHGMGAATGDIDNDGDVDLYVTCVQSNVLYRNNGDGTFTDVTVHAGVDDPRWSASASFLDYDRDGDLDLFVTNYVDFSALNLRECFGPGGAREYCPPSLYRPIPDRLFRNNGNGTFTDVSETAGILSAFGRGLGVLAVDVDVDGWTDIYVANDGTANQLWHNDGDGTFTEIGLLAGAAYNAEGKAEAGMGLAAADYDRDGDTDIFVSHLTRESNTLYQNDDPGMFSDATARLGLGVESLPFTGFGCGWLDYDNDGWVDLFIANGAVEAQWGSPLPYTQRNQLFRGTAAGTFQEMRGPPDSGLELVEVSRGAAFGDLDDDGDIDIVVTNNNGPVRLLLNDVGHANRSLQVRLEAEDNEPVHGARVALLTDDSTPVWRQVQPDGSYLSANDTRVHFGLGPQPPSDAEQIGVVWPDGEREVWRLHASSGEVRLRQGTGEAWQD